jgi:hypothetical protein
MRKGSILSLLAAVVLALLTGGKGYAQTSLSAGLPSGEAFINQVLHVLVDSSFNRYYLLGQADPCSFIKYDYDEWLKYNLQENVPIYILNELAKKCYEDQAPCSWEQDSLTRARCITYRQYDSLIHPFNDLRWNNALTKRQRKAALRQRYKEWEHLPAEEKKVYFFSKPEFTDDGQYAVIDVFWSCDTENALALTYLFRHTSSGWKMIGKTS